VHLSHTLVSAFFGLALLLSLPASSAFAIGSGPIPLVDTGAWCLAPNTSCVDGPWWQAQPDPSSAPSGKFTTYVGLDGLRSDPDFAEAVRLLWQWPEGRQELIGAAGRGVRIVQGPRHRGRSSDTFATYEEETRTVEVAHENMDVPTWMLADLLAHELRHANDLAQGTQAWDGSTGCFALEERAYRTEQRYMAWLVSRFGPLPSETAARDAELSSAADDLYLNMMQIDRVVDVLGVVHQDYAEACSDA
jgi:hypothetical protein